MLFRFFGSWCFCRTMQGDRGKCYVHLTFIQTHSLKGVVSLNKDFFFLIMASPSSVGYIPSSSALHHCVWEILGLGKDPLVPPHWTIQMHRLNSLAIIWVRGLTSVLRGPGGSKQRTKPMDNSRAPEDPASGCRFFKKSLNMKKNIQFEKPAIFNSMR